MRVMRRLLAPILVLALTVEVCGLGAGGYFCPMLGQRLASCCCPEPREQGAGSSLSTAGCCEFLENSVPASSDRLTSQPLSAPERLGLWMDVAQPEASTRTAGLEPASNQASTARSLGKTAVFLALRELLI